MAYTDADFASGRGYLNTQYNSTWNPQTNSYDLNNGGWQFNGDFTPNSVDYWTGAKILGLGQAQGYNDQTLSQLLGMTPEALAQWRAQYSQQQQANQSLGGAIQLGYTQPGQNQPGQGWTGGATGHSTGSGTHADLLGAPYAGLQAPPGSINGIHPMGWYRNGGALGGNQGGQGGYTPSLNQTMGGVGGRGQLFRQPGGGQRGGMNGGF